MVGRSRSCNAAGLMLLNPKFQHDLECVVGGKLSDVCRQLPVPCDKKVARGVTLKNIENKMKHWLSSKENKLCPKTDCGLGYWKEKGKEKSGIITTV